MKSSRSGNHWPWPPVNRRWALVYNGRVTPKEKLTEAIEKFFRRVKEEGRLPDDLPVPKYRRWTGLEPVPCDDFQVEYAGSVRQEAECLRVKDATLEALRRFLGFAVDEQSEVLRVHRLPGA